MKKIRAGIIGTGGISHCHMDGYKTLSDRVEVVAVCDIDEEKVKKYANFGMEREHLKNLGIVDRIKKAIK